MQKFDKRIGRDFMAMKLRQASSSASSSSAQATTITFVGKVERRAKDSGVSKFRGRNKKKREERPFNWLSTSRQTHFGSQESMSLPT